MNGSLNEKGLNMDLLANFDLTGYIYLAYFVFGLWGFLLFSWEWYHRGASFIFKCMTILFLGISHRYITEIYERLFLLNAGIHSPMYHTWLWPARNIISLSAIIVIVSVMTYRFIKRCKKCNSLYEDCRHDK